MAQKLKAKGRALANAVLQLSQHVHKHYPQAVIATLDKGLLFLRSPFDKLTANGLGAEIVRDFRSC